MKVARILQPKEPLEIKQLEIPATVETDMNFLRRRARLVLVGLFRGASQLNLISMSTRAYRLIGSYTGNLSEIL